MSKKSLRYTFGGDEHLFVEIDEAMSLEAFFKSMKITSLLKEQNIDGITEICPANASFQVRFNPDKINGDDLVAKLKTIDAQLEHLSMDIDTRIIEIPVFYNDPWTHETLMRFRERHQTPDLTDIEYAAQINGYKEVKDFIAAHSGTPWFVSMVGFVAGLPFMFQMVERDKQLEVPKYLRPRTDTPKLTIGHGGCFSCIYSVRGAGGYQMFGVTPIPIFDPEQKYSHLADFMIFFKPGDIVKFKAINQSEFDAITKEIDAGTYQLNIKNVYFSLTDFMQNAQSYPQHLTDVLYERGVL